MCPMKPLFIWSHFHKVEQFFDKLVNQFLPLIYSSKIFSKPGLSGMNIDLSSYYLDYNLWMIWIRGHFSTL